MMSGQQPRRDARSRPYPPPPRLRPRGRSTGGRPAANVIGLVCVAILAALAWSVGPDAGSSGGDTDKTPVARQADAGEARDQGTRVPEKKQPPKAVFRVWGSAPAGVETTFGSDSHDVRSEGLPMTGTLELRDDALYYAVRARLRGHGDIRCSVTVGDRTERGRASEGRASDGHASDGRSSDGHAVCEARLPGDQPGGRG